MALAPVIRGKQPTHSDPHNPEACDWQGRGGGRVRGRAGQWRMQERKVLEQPWKPGTEGETATELGTVPGTQ